MATKSSNSEKVGFVTTGYIDKQGTAQGDSAMFNQMPPGMDITNQDHIEAYDMPMKSLVATSYPGDGWGGSN